MSMQGPGIAFLTNEYPQSVGGGIGVYTRVMARYLASQGWRVRVAGIYSQSETQPEYELDEGVEVFRWRRPQLDKGSIRARALLYNHVAAWAQNGEIDLVEAPDAEGWVAFWPKLPVPVVVRVHGSGSYFAREMNKPVPRLGFFLEDAGFRRADFWTSVSRYAGKRTREMFGTRPCDAVHYNPVNVAPQYPLSGRSRNKVVFTGTLTAKKGILELAKAWKQVVRERPDAELHIIGKDLRQGAESMRARMLAGMPDEVAASIRFHGHLPLEQVWASLQEARVAVFPSYAETFGLAPMESMAHGCPTIYSTRTCGPELMESERDALLVDPASPAEIARAILRVLSDDELAGRLSRQGWQHVQQNFGVEAVAPNMERFYTRCMANFARNSAQSSRLIAQARQIVSNLGSQLFFWEPLLTAFVISGLG